MKVLACPFCDGKTDVDGCGYAWFVYCTYCGADGPVRATEKEAIESWNRVCLLVSYGKEFESMMLDAEETREEIDKELGEKEEEQC